MYGNDDNASEGPRGTFEIYRAEADSLYKQGEYRKAIESYTIALELTPNEKNCLVSRSKCYLQLGDMQSALMDAETSLEEDKDFHKGVYQKAQALYYQGDFELALVFYHRGHKLRPELQEFRLGIQKAQEAIDNSVGCKYRAFHPESQFIVIPTGSQLGTRRKSDWSLTKVFSVSPTTSSKFSSQKGHSGAEKKRPSRTRAGAFRTAPDTVKLTTEGDLSFFALQNEKKLKPKAKTYGRPLVAQQQQQKVRDPKAAGSEKTIKQLLGELYGDRQYLEKLLKETDSKSDMGKMISNLVNEGLSYLDTRSDFWRQQKPMYARRHDRLMQRRRREVQSSKLSPNDYIIKELERIDQAQCDGRYKEALQRSQKCLSTVQNFTEEQVPNKVEVVANLYSCIGNAYLELGSYDKALESHQTDLSLGEANDMLEAVSRGLDNTGRVYARSGEFDKAIDVWERKLPMSKSPLESTWLYHEIGRCYLELNRYSQAKDYGEQSFTAAAEAEDQMWQLQASVLIAQAEVKLGELDAAVTTFARSLDLAKSQGDASAETAIQKAIDEVNGRIAAGEGLVNETDPDPGTARTEKEEVKEEKKEEKKEEQTQEQTVEKEEKKEESVTDEGVTEKKTEEEKEDVKSEKKVTIKEEENTEQTQEEKQEEPNQTDTT